MGIKLKLVRLVVVPRLALLPAKTAGIAVKPAEKRTLASFPNPYLKFNAIRDWVNEYS
ncbi:hypothetical protein D3C73_1465850 [compost metagenome]